MARACPISVLFLPRYANVSHSLGRAVIGNPAVGSIRSHRIVLRAIYISLGLGSNPVSKTNPIHEKDLYGKDDFFAKVHTEKYLLYPNNCFKYFKSLSQT